MENRLPPRQVWTELWPRIGERHPAAMAPDDANWRLVVDGLVEHPQDLSLADLANFPQEELTTDIHCVTRWSRRDLRFSGVDINRVIDKAGVRSEARFLRFVASSDRPDGHDTSLPIALARAGGILLVTAVDGEPLERVHGGPLRSVVPSRYFYKSLKWLVRIEVMGADRMGFWERSGYDNNGDFRKEQRYVSGNLSTNEIARLKGPDDLLKFRGTPIISVDLSGMKLAGSNLADLTLRNCSLRGVDLQRAHLKHCNLTNSDLRGADLRGAVLSHCDLDGVDLCGANLEGARLAGVLANALTFYREGEAPAKVRNLRISIISGSEGFPDSQARFLVDHGVEVNAFGAGV